MQITPAQFTSLFPLVAPADLWSSPWAKQKSDPIGTLLADIQRTKDTYLQIQYGKLALFQNNQQVEPKVDYGQYLQVSNSEVRRLAREIVSPRDSDDVKAEKIRAWIEENVTYADDLKTYKTDEYWALPSMTLRNGQGDCEDGAFLQASLMLASGVDPDRVRVYGGFVSAGTNASTGGHAWVAYQRETDDEWVAMDWCYFPTDEAVSERTELRKDYKYQDDYFYITATETVETPYVNTIRDLSDLPKPYRKALAQQPGQIFEAVA
jgi:hypothetical protein